MNDIGTDIMTRMKIAAGPGVWAFDDCLVTEYAPGRYTVYMETEKGDIVCQDVEDRGAGFTREMLDAGRPLTEGWTLDVNGYDTCPENGELCVAPGEYAFETYNGNCGDVRCFDGYDEAVCEAQGEWSHLSESDRRRYMNAKGGMFRVYDCNGYVVYDCIENARLAADRQADADWAREDPERLNSWFKGFRARHGEEEADGCIALFDGGWDGTEDPCDLMLEYRICCDNANATLDFLTMFGVMKELEKER